MTPVLLFLAAVVAFEEPAASPRKTTSLNGAWEFKQGEPEGVSPRSSPWKTVTVPQAWQHHEGMEFHGVGVYRKTLDPFELKEGRRLLVHFDAVATHATVYWNGEKLGEHLGPWTPFRFDVTELVRKKPKEKHTLTVRVDEKVGHNTQGFLPIVQPHFGGIWQEVKLIEVGEPYFDDADVAVGAGPRGDVRFKLRFAGGGKPVGLAFRLWKTLDGKRERVGEWRGDELPELRVEGQEIAGEWNSLGLRLWAPDFPQTYEFEAVSATDRVSQRFGHTIIFPKDDQLVFNGQPLSIRGVLNWGYYPPNLAPNVDPEVWRQDLKLIKSWGFNLMKCCLWVPPRRLLEIADEEGVLVWMEYPTWHPKLTPEFLPDLEREYAEFFRHDRHHPSVILRSLTCETGQSADLKVIQKLTDAAKQMIPGCLVVDDSSWIEWNRVCDFYDDHPYGNNHTWVKTLERLKGYIAKSKLGVKPLVLGEAIAADTWHQVGARQEALGASEEGHRTVVMRDGKARPYHEPIFADANRAWLARMEKIIGGPIDQKRLTDDSLRYAMLMRKFQIETFRKEVPNGGYVVSVMRDFPLAGMGLISYDGKPKWEAKDWAWHGEKKNEGVPWPKVDQSRLAKVAAPMGIRTAHQFDERLLDELEAGGKVLLMPNGKEGSLPLKSHWFLRGGPFVNAHHPLLKGTTGLHELLVEQQHFDLAGDVVPDVQYLEEIDPILMLWDNHDMPEVKTHGLAFETRVGKGRLLVSALNHAGGENAVGRWLLDVFLKHLDEGPPPRNALKPETIGAMRNKLREKRLELVGQPWRFKPDPKEEGVKAGWATMTPDESWKPIRIGQSWEGQGYATLDGWAWYRLDVTVPQAWAGLPVWWQADGVDDHAEFYVNGQKVGSMGDLAGRKTAFEDKAAFDISKHVKAGAKATLAVRVFDWQGAGGCHRPQRLATVPRTAGAEILK